MPTYKTKNGLDYTLPGIGVTKDGQITTDKVIENANFELVAEQAAAPQVAPAPAPAPQPPVETPPAPQPAPVENQTNKETN